MMLKKYMASFLSAVMLWGAVPVFAAEVENPSCVMLKFDDATRFANLSWKNLSIVANSTSKKPSLWKQIWLRLYMRIDWLNLRQIKHL